MTIIPIILSGGAGTRLWPLSWGNHPKQFLSLISDKTMIQETLLLWFIENCLDSINAKLVVVGSGMDKYKGKYGHNVIFKGFVEDLGYEYYCADLVVLPILSGSGMKTKTCESFMYGKTVVGSKEAFEGYDKCLYKNGCGVMCTTKEDYIETINKLLDTEQSKINYNSRRLYIDLYETSSYEKKLEESLK